MEESIPSLSSGTVGSRFVSQDEIETTRKRREEQWKAAYARLGQEPPPQPTEDSYDGRSLAEKLAANKAAKQEEWEERNRLANQFRALEEDEVLFLDTVRERQEEEERARQEQDNEELRSFRQAVAAREALANKSSPVLTDTTGTPQSSGNGAKPSSGVTTGSKPAKPANTASTGKSAKNSLKGVLVKKKQKKVASSAASTETAKRPNTDQANESESQPASKKQKVTES
ncbi:hypothetical protein GLOTRDRAFT_124454 [Gloeophyllum trabeum ATCC 11539]|uniref:FAM192A/Fyv6 N-terminal domain-containing protein n=1 Tax=Gloeophyllum trabeum (strain ATCC 11539 / FP-39264 / Madison 617) TaxID=670483 RepID=S7QMB0_GLOTA|nr:uncharacterized protein GLOTRDRAFT_124454 [Gloeophyllum trabeum ATCC 11539]EPQ60701.1 hypothetical protein GLOTRDRAFT_124454 [Gloeophyllum trabeum ATCC 11539]